MRTRLQLVLLVVVATASFPVLAQPPPGEPAAEPEEENGELQEMLDWWSHFQISGYVQGELRVRSQEDEDDHNDNDDLFAVRRGRVKIKFKYSLAEFMIQIDAIPSGVAVRDAEATLVIPWTDDIHTRLTAGLFKNPWGIDILMSSRDRAFPERSLLARSFFPGERDIGLRLSGDVGDVFDYQVALMNGQPIGSPGIEVAPGNTVRFDVGEDANNAKDVVGRFGLTFEPLAFGVSGMFGRGFAPAIPDDPATMMIDESQASFDFTRWGVGLDVRFTQDVGIGELDVYGEFSLAGNLDRSAVPANEDADAIQHMGWYIAAVQQIGDHFGGAVRFEQYDKNTGAADDARLALTVAALFFPVEHTRVTAAVQHTMPESGDAAQEYWLRLQVDF